MTAGPPVVVIGAGQSGLAPGYYLQQFGVEFTVLADDQRVGDTWRDRWVSLELFTPAFYSGLPGLDFVGLHWQARPDSSLTGGVGPDAKHVAKRIREGLE